MNAIVDQKRDIDQQLAAVPEEHRGVMYERTFSYFNPQRNTQELQRALAILWARRNSETENLLVHLLHPHAKGGQEPDPRQHMTPQNEREWLVAQLVAATVIQWLGTAVGSAFLVEAFKRSGGELHYMLPLTKDTSRL